jgi:hypothetical protein
MVVAGLTAAVAAAAVARAGAWNADGALVGAACRCKQANHTSACPATNSCANGLLATLTTLSSTCHVMT